MMTTAGLREMRVEVKIPKKFCGKCIFLHNYGPCCHCVLLEADLHFEAREKDTDPPVKNEGKVLKPSFCRHTTATIWAREG